MLTLTYMKRKENMKAYLFLLPSLALAATFLFYPLMKAFASSFLTISHSGKILGFAGFKNYAKLFSDSGFRNAALNTIKFIIFFVPLNTALTLLAATLTRKKRKGTAIAEFIFASPIVISLSAYALIFKEMFRGRISIINRIFSSEINWLSDKVPAMFVVKLKKMGVTIKLDDEEGGSEISDLLCQDGGSSNLIITHQSNVLDFDEDSSKNKKAKDLGVPIISENDFLELLKAAD